MERAGYASLHHTCRLGIAVATLPAPLVVPGFGELWLDLGAGCAVFDDVVLAQLGRVVFTVPVPALPQLVGLPLHVQALVEQARYPARFTAHRSIVIQ